MGKTSIDKESLKKRILEEGEILNINSMVTKCLGIDIRLLPVLKEWVENGVIKDTWIQNGKIEEINIEGFTINRLMKMYGKFSSSIIRVNLLIKHPKDAREMLETLEKAEKIIL